MLVRLVLAFASTLLSLFFTMVGFKVPFVPDSVSWGAVGGVISHTYHLRLHHCAAGICGACYSQLRRLVGFPYGFFPCDPQRVHHPFLTYSDTV